VVEVVEVVEVVDMATNPFSRWRVRVATLALVVWKDNPSATTICDETCDDGER
jgi:hypothetical protein